MSTERRARSAALNADRASRLAVVEDLRELLRQHGKGGTLVDTRASMEALNTHDPLELSLTLRPGSLGVIAGSWASGKTSLALRHVAQATGEGRRAAVVDGTGWLFPPALALLEVDLQRTLIIQPPSTRAVWAAEQVLRSGLFPLVVLLEHHQLDRSSLRRLQLAAEGGDATGLLVQSAVSGDSYGGLVALRLRVESFAAPAAEHLTIAAPPQQQRVTMVRRGSGQEVETTPSQLEVALA